MPPNFKATATAVRAARKIMSLKEMKQEERDRQIKENQQRELEKNANLGELIKIAKEKAITDYNQYLSNSTLIINVNENEKLKQDLIYNIFELKDNENNFENETLKRVLEEINIEIKEVAKENNKKYNIKCIGNIETNKWTECLGKCQLVLKKYLDEELNSTAYMLRVLSNSYIKDETRDSDKYNIVFKFNLSQETPINISKVKLWKNISKNISKDILKDISNFPKIFLSIDGGNYRSYSIIYKYIVELLEIYNVGGFTNMKPDGIFNNIVNRIKQNSLFNSTQTKKDINEYLIYLKSKNLLMSLYVPDTLGSINYEKYIKLTDDNEWTALLIWQHKFGPIDCTYSKYYICTVCTQSGKSREIEEGKKYSNSTYKVTLENGEREFKKGKYRKYKIHNCGRVDGISIIEDHSIDELKFENVIPINNSKLFKFNNPNFSSYHYIKYPDYSGECKISKTVTLVENTYGFPELEGNPDTGEYTKEEEQEQEDSFINKYLKYKYKYLQLKRELKRELKTELKKID